MLMHHEVDQLNLEYHARIALFTTCRVAAAAFAQSDVRIVQQLLVSVVACAIAAIVVEIVCCVCVSWLCGWRRFMLFCWFGCGGCSASFGRAVGMVSVLDVGYVGVIESSVILVVDVVVWFAIRFH